MMVVTVVVAVASKGGNFFSLLFHVTSRQA
jgi:hypothetical protein